MTEAHHTLGNVELFAGLPAAELEALAGRCRWRRYAAGRQIIYHLDETSDVYFIVEGRVHVTVYSPSGKEVAFRDLGPGKSFGEISAVDGAPRSATVVALTDALLASMPAEIFRRMLRERPEIAERMMRHLAGLVRLLSDRVVEFGVLAVKNRIDAELLRLAREYGVDGNAATLSPAPTHADIASRVATHREAVTRELNALARGGLIERRKGALVIPDIDRLARLVERGLED